MKSRERRRGRFERREHAGQADRRMRAVVEGQQQQFEMRREPSSAVAVTPAIAGSISSATCGDDVLDLAAAAAVEQRRRNSGPSGRGRAGRRPACRRRGTGSRFRVRRTARRCRRAARAPRSGSIVAAVRRPRVAALLVPIGEELAARRMFHSKTLPRGCAGGTHLSRFRARAIPSLLCRRGGAASMPGRDFGRFGRRLCGVKVKLTMRLASARGCYGPLTPASPVSPGSGEAVVHRASNSLVIARGGVGIPRSLRRGKISTNRAGRSQRPALFSLCHCALAQGRQSRLSRAHRSDRRREGLRPLGISRISRQTCRTSRRRSSARADPDAAGAR